LVSEKPVVDFAQVRTFTCVIGVGSPAGREGGRGDHRPDPAPFPAKDRTPTPPADDQHSRQWHAQNGRGEGVRRSVTGEAQRPSAPGRRAGESPPTTRRTPLDAGGMGARNGEQRPGLRCRGAPVKKQTCSATEGRDRRPDAGYGRPQAHRRTQPDDGGRHI